MSSAAHALVELRSRLQRAAAVVALLIVPAFLFLLVASGPNEGSDGLAYRLAEKWIPLLPVLLGIPAVVLLVAAWAVRFLPSGREAAQAAPMLRRSRAGGPRPVSVLAVLGLVVLLVFAPWTAVETYHGVRALTGGGLVLTVGEDTSVTRSEDRAGRAPGENRWLGTPYGEAIAEGNPSPGDRFGVYPPDGARAWEIGPRGWLTVLFVGALGIAMLAGIAALARAQWRRFAARRRWRAQRPRRGGALAAAYATTAGLLAAGATTWVVVDEASAGGTRITMAIPGADEYGLSSFWVRDDAAEHPFYGVGEGAPAAPVQSRRLDENRDADLGLVDVWATVTAYPSARDAATAAELWLDEQQGKPVTLDDGTAARWDERVGELTTATTRGPVLVMVEVNDHSWEETPEEVTARLLSDAPAIRGLVVDHRQEILDAEFPWWG